jgi:hypothetical protein
MRTRNRKRPAEHTRAGKGGRAAVLKGVADEVEREAETESGPEAIKAVGGKKPGGSHRRPGGSVSDAPRARLGSANTAASSKKVLMRQSAVAPRAEPSRRGANQWVSGRKNRRKYR